MDEPTEPKQLASVEDRRLAAFNLAKELLLKQRGFSCHRLGFSPSTPLPDSDLPSPWDVRTKRDMLKLRKHLTPARRAVAEFDERWEVSHDRLCDDIRQLPDEAFDLAKTFYWDPDSSRDGGIEAMAENAKLEEFMGLKQRSGETLRLIVVIGEERTLANKKSRKEEYLEYLESDTWREVRAKALTHYGKTCVLCGESKRLQVHHRNYERVGGAEEMSDLVVLCRDCHAKFHDKLPQLVE